MRNLTRLILVLGLALLAPVSYAMRVAEANAARVLRSDLIVRGKVSKLGAATQEDFTFPGSKVASKQWLVSAEITVTKAIRGQAGATLTVLCQAPAPPPKPDPAAPAGFIRPMMSDGVQYPTLVAEQEYLLLLQQLPGDKYLLPADFGCLLPVAAANKERVEQMERLAAVDQWGWSKAVNGLQLALLPDQENVTIFKVMLPIVPGAKERGIAEQARTMAAIAVRNTSEQPVALRLFAPENFLSVTFPDPSGKALNCPGFTAGAGEKAAFDAEKHLVTLAPGEIKMLAPYGLDPFGQELRFENPAPKFQVTASYRNQTAGKTAAGVPVWTGELQALSPPMTASKR